MTSLDGINCRSIQTLLRGENVSKQSDEIQATSHPVMFILFPRHMALNAVICIMKKNFPWWWNHGYSETSDFIVRFYRFMSCSLKFPNLFVVVLFNPIPHRRSSSRGGGTRDEALRTSAWVAGFVFGFNFLMLRLAWISSERKRLEAIGWISGYAMLSFTKIYHQIFEIQRTVGSLCLCSWFSQFSIDYHTQYLLLAFLRWASSWVPHFWLKL